MAAYGHSLSMSGLQRGVENLTKWLYNRYQCHGISMGSVLNPSIDKQQTGISIKPVKALTVWALAANMG